MKHKVAINAVEIGGQNGQVPEWVPLVPAGRVLGRDGRAWNNNRPESIVAGFAELGRDLPIDIEHSTEHKAPKGDPAPAIGWIKEVQERNGEIWGRADWNETGRRLVSKQAYRYLSPVIVYQPSNGTIVGVTSVGVTNQPNLKLPALNSEQGAEAPKEEEMLKALLAALGLPETASESDAMGKIAALKSDLATATNRADNPSLEKFVPRADYDAALAKASNAEQKLAAIKGEQLEASINSAIEQALQDGKITPATADYHKAQCRQEGGLDRFAAYCAAAPVIGGDSGLDKKTQEEQSKALNAEQQKVAEMFGNTAEDLAKYGK